MPTGIGPILVCWAALTQRHNPGSLNNRNVLSHGSGG